MDEPTATEVAGAETSSEKSPNKRPPRRPRGISAKKATTKEQPAPAGSSEGDTPAPLAAVDAAAAAPAKPGARAPRSRRSAGAPKATGVNATDEAERSDSLAAGAEPAATASTDAVAVEALDQAPRHEPRSVDQSAPAAKESAPAAKESAPAAKESTAADPADGRTGEASAGAASTRRSRRRRSSRRGGSPEGQSKIADLAESTEGEAGETVPVPAGPDALAAGAGPDALAAGATVEVGPQPAPVPAPSEKSERSDRSDRSERSDSGSARQSSGSGKRRRKSTRRPRMEHIAPLGPRKMLVTKGDDRSQIAVLEGRELIEHYVAKTQDTSIVGNVYVGRVENVLPGMEAAFLDIGEARNAVLYVGEVSYEEELEGPQPRIETLLKSGQAVVAQVTKDPMGAKGARLTTEVSIAGRYLVLVPNTDSLGISRRLSDNERRRLRDIGSRIRPEGHGLIVRTAAIGVSEEDLERDANRLIRIWTEVESKSKNAKPPKLIYSEPPLAIRVVRDLFSADVEQVLVDDEGVRKQIREYLEEMAPDFAQRVELYEDPLSLFERYHVTEQIRKAVDRKVWLPSGGHIVIDRTEAMTVVDVNTGRFVGRSTLEETVLHANLEAAEEVAKQLRLRDIGGIIVIDFIDMGYERNREELLRVFENALLRDKTRTQVYGVSELGLVQMTRKKVSEGLLDAFSHMCTECEGRGIILHSFD